MCNRLIGLAVLGLVSAPASPSHAQEGVRNPLRHRADSLAREWRQAEAFALVVDSVERSRASALDDTVSVGALRIITNRSPLPVREAAVRAWLVIDSLYGPESTVFAERPYIIHAVDPDTSVKRPGVYSGFQVEWTSDIESVTRLLLATVPTSAPDQRLRDWLGGPVRPLNRRHVQAVTYLGLVTAPSSVARGCLIGQLAACRNGLDVGDAALSLDDWYPDPSDRRFLVTNMFAGYFDRGGTAASNQSCLAGNDSSCITLLRMLPSSVVPKPLGLEARRSLVDLALRVGGRDAYRRLMSDSASSMAARLSKASGLSTDSLISLWREEILSARPTPVPLSIGAFGMGLLWAAIFGLCGLRSSRWRLQ